MAFPPMVNPRIRIQLCLPLGIKRVSLVVFQSPGLSLYICLCLPVIFNCSDFPLPSRRPTAMVFPPWGEDGLIRQRQILCPTINLTNTRWSQINWTSKALVPWSHSPVPWPPNIPLLQIFFRPNVNTSPRLLVSDQPTNHKSHQHTLEYNAGFGDCSSPDDSSLYRKKFCVKNLATKLFHKSSSYLSNVHLIYRAYIYPKIISSIQLPIK